MYKCDKCDKEFEYFSLLKKHQMRKTPCITPDDYLHKITEIDTTIDVKTKESYETETQCKFCDKEFLNKSNLTKHINIVCPIRKGLLKDKDKIIENKRDLDRDEEIKKRDAEIKILRDGFTELLKKHSSTNINIINNKYNKINDNSKIINNNLIVINSFGKENLSHITNDDYKKYLSGYFPGFINFIEKVHFDENMPENNNICITNLKSKFMYTHDGSKWVTMNKDDVIDKFIKNKYNHLSDKCDELEETNEIDEKTLNKFLSFAQNYKDEEAEKNTKDKILLMIYNNKDKIKLK